MSRTLIIGVGNEFRGDDAVGLVMARRLKEIVPDTIEIIEHSGEGASLMQAWEGADRVYLIDAVNSGAEAGTIHRLDGANQPVPTEFFHYSTHAFSVAEAVEVARKLDLLPRTLIIYGVEGAVFDHGAPLSPEVSRAADAIFKQFLQELA